MGDALGFGVDVGGSGIKGSVVDIERGVLAEERIRVPTPQPSTPTSVADAVGEVAEKFSWSGPIGLTLPSVINHGIARTAANIDRSWIDTDARSLFADRLGKQPEEIVMLNDADAAGIAEMRSGAGVASTGLVVLLTFGTGIGSAMFVDGKLIPNTEFGHIEVDGQDAESQAAASVKDSLGLSYPEWAPRVSRYIQALESFLWPDLIIAGGGVSRKAQKWLPLLESRTPIVAAELKNDAGIVGAATAATESAAQPG